MIIVHGDGVVGGSMAPMMKKTKIRRGNYNETATQLNKKYMEELLSREKKAFDNQINSLKLQHEKMQEDIYKQQQNVMKDRQMRQKYSAHPPKHSKSQKPASKDRQPKTASM